MRGSSFDPVSIETLNRRLIAVTLVAVIIIATLVLRLWFLQIISGNKYRTQSENNRIHLQKIPPFRGMIFDRNGGLLVDNRPSYNLYITPEDIQDREQLLKSLDVLINMSPEKVIEKLDKAPHQYPFKPILVKRNMPRDEVAIVETNQFNLPGTMILVEPQRNYVYNSSASHIIGYLGEINEGQLNSGKYPESSPGDLIGKFGVEGRWQTSLVGLRGGRQVEVDAAGRILRVLSSIPPVPGQNISLTIDKDLQLLAEGLFKGKKGAVVAMDPNSGEVLALVSSPAFDPNLFVGGIDKKRWEEMISNKDFPLQNKAISGQYSPGSVFKIVISLAGLEEGVIDPEEEIFCPGYYRLGNRTYHCWKKSGHGNVNFHKALRESCDVYYYEIGKRLGVDKIAYYANRFGLGKKTDFDLDYEKEGLIPTREWKLKKRGVPWQKGETIILSIGQSFLLTTPLQMVRVISAIFNGGIIYQPKIVTWVEKDEKITQFSPNVTGRLDAEPENLEFIKNALIGVVNEEHGTGGVSRIKGIVVAGKTGTAQVITLEAEKRLNEEGDIPDEFKDHAWFVAIAPANEPKLAISVLIEHGGHGGSAAAPIAREMLKKYLGVD
ncbi:penicillin-binding protein 2 [Thermodesulfobacteriota bacterium]